ncbi:sortase [Candidatus Daviesbacteria bacterium]|nr:sortase [Candidatus Daviesbacteria bacterium]
MKTTFLVRFLAYFFIIVGFLALVFEFGPVAQTEFTYRYNKFFQVRYVIQPVVGDITQTQPPPSDTGGVGFGQLGAPTEKIIQPVSTEYGIVIEKINANAKVVPDIDVGNEKEYVKALQTGVAEAKGSTKPGENGNLFIFSHSADAPWNIVRFNAIFYLLRELNPGDRVIVFYQGRRYDYEVFDKNITDPKDISYLVNRYDKPVLTLQTCDPPGTLSRRLIVRAKLMGS